MTSFRIRAFVLAGALVAALPGARAGTLTIVDVSAPQIICVFHSDCSVPTADTTGVVGLPYVAKAGTALMQSRTFAGAAGAPAAGLTAYEYRLNFAQAAGNGGCIYGFVVNFGPIKKVAYQNASPKGGQLADVYVITSGSLGTVGLKSAEQDGDVITFELQAPLCLGATPSNANTTYFFGMASASTPTDISAGVYGPGSPPYFAVNARGPKH
jgi:hypothetical protein